MDRKLLRQKVSALAGLFAIALPWPVLAGPDNLENHHSSMLAKGRYLVKVAGCNDCHTRGYKEAEGKIPEAQWLTGDSFGWRGPWGTTYAANLRLTLGNLTEEQWLIYAKSLRTRPPMPWFNLNIMEDVDLQAIYQFIQSLGPAGQPAPEFVPPDREPQPPFALFPSPEPE